ncbi:hypothetical protein mRhiFer1_007977 [Rhinolophus ferrumequinum]|uniref:Secreted protein n=1 Tax=Rhinolophus ferrumequinum TaxID=59479 RepID=A0A7J8AVX1_RHIFE|nr:hypothetical protein mRhiFer1_007977 [Rhinolophus ferrumequinum]
MKKGNGHRWRSLIECLQLLCLWATQPVSAGHLFLVFFPSKSLTSPPREHPRCRSSFVWCGRAWESELLPAATSPRLTFQCHRRPGTALVMKATPGKTTVPFHSHKHGLVCGNGCPFLSASGRDDS